MILDCTLRDGGFYNDWQWPAEQVERYYAALPFLPIHFVEVGYLRHEPAPPDLAWDAGKAAAVMLDAKRYRDALPDYHRIGWDLVRIASSAADLPRALQIAERSPVPCTINLMRFTDWMDDERFLDSLAACVGAVDYLYIVDSYGAAMPEDVETVTRRVRERVGNLPLGFHAHNNQEMALANTRRALALGYAMVDCTVSGMGRGAGNLRTELLLLNQGHDLGPELAELCGAFQGGWGPRIPYIVSGARGTPQDRVMRALESGHYSEAEAAKVAGL